MKFVNTNWGYPGDIPEELTDLHPGTESFLCPIMVFCELTNRLSPELRSTRAGYHFAKGRIGLYESSSYIGDYGGTRSIVRTRERDMSSYMEEDLLRIHQAFQWLQTNNRIFRDQGPVEDGAFVSDIPKLIRMHRQETHVDVNESLFQDEIMMPVYEGGPQTADEENKFENLVFGVDDNRNLVSYRNPRLMGYLFPSLYVKGEGFYSLNYAGIPDPATSVIDVHECR